MRVLLPESATIKDLTSGEVSVKDAFAGQTVVGYDVRERGLRPAVLTSVIRHPAAPGLRLCIDPVGQVDLSPSSGVYTVSGPCSAMELRSTVYGFCILNNQRLSTRRINAILEVDLPCIELVWDTEVMLWSQGILVGSPR